MPIVSVMLAGATNGGKEGAPVPLSKQDTCALTGFPTGEKREMPKPKTIEVNVFVQEHSDRDVARQGVV